jgi:hypothetical protein
MADKRLQVRLDPPRIKMCLMVGTVAAFWIVGLFAILTGTA